MLDFLDAILPVLAVLAIIILFFVMFYVKSPPNKALLISGPRRHKPPKNDNSEISPRYRIVVGGGTLRIPFFERIDRLPLEVMQVDIRTSQSVPTSEYIGVMVDGVANIKINSSFSAITKAAEQFLGKKPREIGETAMQVLEGNMREIIGQMTISDLVQNRDRFAQMTQSAAMVDMERMGLEIINLTIQNFSDDDGVLQDLAAKNVAEIKKNAAIGRSEAERDTLIAQSIAKQEGHKQQAEADATIAEQEKMLQVRTSQYKIEQETARAKAESAYAIQEQEQRKAVETARINADISRSEREILLKDNEIHVAERTLNAQIRKQADADRYAREQAAQAAKYEAQQQAEAARYTAEQNALAIQAEGLAEASAIREKAEAMRLMGDASILQMTLDIMPELVKQAATPMANVDKLVMYGNGNSDKLIGDVMNVSSQVVEGLRQATGLDLAEIIQNATSKKPSQHHRKNRNIPS